MQQNKYQSSMPCGFRLGCFSCFPHISLCKIYDPWGRFIFGSNGIIWTNMIEVDLVMLHTKYQVLGLVVSDKKTFSCFPYISLYKTCDPQGRTKSGHRGKSWTTLVEAHLVMLHTKYQCSRPGGFRLEYFLIISLYKPMLIMWPRGYNLNTLGRGSLDDAS